jgi:hypothetical protein
MDSGLEPSLDSGANVGWVSGLGASPSLGVDQISLVSPKATSLTSMDTTMVTGTKSSLGYGEVVGRVTVPEAFLGLWSSTTILGSVLTLFGLVQAYSRSEFVMAFSRWEFIAPTLSVHVTSFPSTHVSTLSFPTTSIPYVQVFGPALSEKELGIEEFPLMMGFIFVGSDFSRAAGLSERLWLLFLVMSKSK